MGRTRGGILSVALFLALLVGGSLLGGGPRGLALQATPVAEGGLVARPVHIHSGNCNNLGEIAYPLTDLTAPTGDEVGQANRAVLAESSFTNVPATLDALLADNYAINVHLSADEIGTYIACGELGGVLDANGALVIGLKQQNNSGFTGVAYLFPGADGASTNVSVFVASEEASRAARRQAAATPAAGGAEAAATPQATAGASADVSLTEWQIAMPTDLPAGTVTFRITNDGTVPHSFEIEGQGIEQALDESVQPGDTAELTVDLAPGTYTVYCPLGDGAHRAQGMELEVTVA